MFKVYQFSIFCHSILYLFSMFKKKFVYKELPQ
jgi:hypothetical protein